MKTIDKTEDMKETEFEPGEYCRFPSYEIQSMIDLLQENKYKVVQYPDVSDCEFIVFENGEFIPNQTKSFGTELTREQFMFKATRGKGVKPGFDPTKPFEVSHDGENFMSGNFTFIGMHEGFPVIYSADNSQYIQYGAVRNSTEPFHAGMLNYGQYMIVDDPDLPPGSDPAVLVRTEHGGLVNIKTGEQWADLSAVKGRRVRVNITTEEI